ncbi:MAG: DUF3568 family protein [Verrucomicrobia bacterium]|nr:DUF3568 family protein [Verrucomicrobiota bacterium]
MKKNVFALLAACTLIALFTGCYSTLDGHMKPAVVPFAKDTITSRYERPVDQIVEAAKNVLTHNGTLTGENRISNPVTVEAKIDTRTVWVAVDEVEPKISRVRVQVRKKGGSPDIDLASEIDKQIALQLPRQ